MHIVGLILAPALGYALYWFIYLDGHEWLAALWDKKKREERARQSAELARLQTLRAVRDPRDAAAALMFLVARMEGDITSAQTQRIETELRDVLGFATQKDAIERLALARHIAGTAPSATVAIQELLPLLTKQLGEEEKRDLVAMLERVAAVGGPANDEQIAFIDRIGKALPPPETGWGQRTA